MVDLKCLSNLFNLRKPSIHQSAAAFIGCVAGTTSITTNQVQSWGLYVPTSHYWNFPPLQLSSWTCTPAQAFVCIQSVCLKLQINQLLSGAPRRTKKVARVHRLKLDSLIQLLQQWKNKNANTAARHLQTKFRTKRMVHFIVVELRKE